MADQANPIDPKIASYIDEAVKRGDSREKIKSSFISTGWTEPAIEDVLSAVIDKKPLKTASREIPYIALAIIILVLGLGVFAFLQAPVRDKIILFAQSFTQPKTPTTKINLPIETVPSINETVAESNKTQENDANTTKAANISQEPVETPAEEKPKGDITLLQNPCTNIAQCKGIVYGIGGEPSFAWTGSEYGIAWAYHDSGESRLYFTRIDRFGNKLSDDIEINKYDGDSGAPSIIWTGTFYGLVWPVRDKLFLLQLNPTGNQIGNPVDISSNENKKGISSATIAWKKPVYGVAWEQDSNTYFAQFDTTGKRIGNLTEISVSSEDPHVVLGGDEYGIAWVEDKGAEKKIYLTRIDNESRKIGDIRMDEDFILCDEVSLSWAEQSYGLLYSCVIDNKLTNPDDRDISFMRVYSTGGKAELIALDFGMVRMSEEDGRSSNPSVVLSEKNYGGVWEDSRDGNSEIYFGRIFYRTGTKKEPEQRLTSSKAESLYPQITRTDTEYGIVWAEKESNLTHIYFGYLS